LETQEGAGKEQVARAKEQKTEEKELAAEEKELAAEEKSNRDYANAVEAAARYNREKINANSYATVEMGVNGYAVRIYEFGSKIAAANEIVKIFDVGSSGKWEDKGEIQYGDSKDNLRNKLLLILDAEAVKNNFDITKARQIIMNNDSYEKIEKTPLVGWSGWYHLKDSALDDIKKAFPIEYLGEYAPAQAASQPPATQITGGTAPLQAIAPQATQQQPPVTTRAQALQQRLQGVK